MEQLRLVIVVFTVFLGVIFIAFPLFLEKSSIYYPSRVINATPSRWGLKYEDVYFPAADGTKLNGWYVPFENATLTTLWLHANAHNISGAYETEMMVAIQKRMKTDLFIFDYRGYGRSEGRVSEAGTYSDGQGALDFLKGRGTPVEDIILFGHSLGTAVAVELASKEMVRGVALWSPFTSVADMGRLHYPVLGHIYTSLPWFPRIKYDSMSKIKRLRSPLLVIHGAGDRLTPLSMAQRLYDAAQTRKEMAVIPEGDHNYMSEVGWRMLLDSVDSFVRMLEKE